jgi:predicted RNA-binding protein YlxR (DUF448 family)
MLASADAAELDDGPRTKSGTERLCALTRQVKPIGELIRFVVGPDGSVVPDLKRKLPGRGLWITSSRAMVADAARRGVFARGFKRQVQVPPALAADIGALMARAVADALAMAAKAGEAVSGFTKVERSLTEGTAVALIHASDAAADGVRKLNAIARRSAETTGIGDFTAGLPIIDALSSDELDLALGRSNVIHAALLAGAAAKTVLVRSDTLTRFRNGGDTASGG